MLQMLLKSKKVHNLKRFLENESVKRSKNEFKLNSFSLKSLKYKTGNENRTHEAEQKKMIILFS